MSDNDYDVVIAGAGIAGLTAALGSVPTVVPLTGIRLGTGQAAPAWNRDRSG